MENHLFQDNEYYNFIVNFITKVIKKLYKIDIQIVSPTSKTEVQFGYNGRMSNKIKIYQIISLEDLKRQIDLARNNLVYT